jgi:predicted RNase H-like HicB family nuclease
LKAGWHQGINVRYPIVIEPGNNKTAFGVVVPDMPGCFSTGDTLEEAISNAEIAAAAWIDTQLDRGLNIPQPSELSELQKDPKYAKWIWAVITIDPALLDDRIERVNITLPRRVLKRLDDAAKAVGETRSGYIAQLALK